MSIQSATSGSSASALSPARVSYRLPLLLAPCAAFRYRGVLSTAASAFWATVAVRYRAQSSRSALGTRAASPVALHRGNPSSAPAACDSIAPVPRCGAPDIGPAPSRFWQVGFQYRSNAPQTGFQYCAVDSITTSSTSCSTNHSDSNRRWSGVVPNWRLSELLVSRWKLEGRRHYTDDLIACVVALQVSPDHLSGSSKASRPEPVA